MNPLPSDRHSFTPFHQMIPGVVRRMNLTRQVDGALVCQRFRKVAETLWGPEVSAKVSPRSFAKNTLTVDVAHSGWAQEVQLKKITLLKELRAFPDMPEVRDLKLRLR